MRVRVKEGGESGRRGREGDNTLSLANPTDEILSHVIIPCGGGYCNLHWWSFSMTNLCRYSTGTGGGGCDIVTCTVWWWWRWCFFLEQWRIY